MRAEALTSAFAVAQEFNFGGGERGVRVRGGGAEQEGEGTYLSIREIIAELGKPTGAPHAENGFGTGGDERPLRAYTEGRGGGGGRFERGARRAHLPQRLRSPQQRSAGRTAQPNARGSARSRGRSDAPNLSVSEQHSAVTAAPVPPPPHRPLTAQAGDAPLPPAPAAPPQVFFISARSETIPPAL